ncbi:MAG TPA: 3-deoxy-manno-octulosonate cytidylyltransferase [Victivallales bacterium]|nr:3-deoxy-manno-octulosonate cytidylyltransferase [Victivallales bacterium]HRU01826.1 3-deoxy-manno-octulosonate cytidylyltransferase [Victivallales bacterium]
MKLLIVIPARFASTRFPGKPIALLGGKPVIQYAYENAVRASVGPVVVATDDERILKVVEAFGGLAVMTSPEHPSGTDRVKEAMDKFMPDCDAVINLQGDEPFVPVELLEEIAKRLEISSDEEIVTVAVRAKREEISGNPNIVKVVVDSNMRALYFSRASIPYLREGGQECGVFRHWGIYAFRKKAINRFVSLPESPLEKCEKLEQLRALENGMNIFVIITSHSSIGIDTQQDLREAEKFLIGSTTSNLKRG